MSNNDWVEKYKPQNISDLDANKKALYSIQNWLTYFENLKIKKPVIAEKKTTRKNSKKKVEKEVVTDDEYNETNEEPNEEIDYADYLDADNDSGDTKKSKSKSKSNDVYSCLLVTGPHGVGKTLYVNMILQHKEYEITHIDFSNIKTVKDMKDYINKKISCTDVLSIMQGETKKKIAIVIDEIESVTSSNEKSNLILLQKLNDVQLYCPIVFISNNKHNKLLSEIKKKSYVVPFYAPYPIELKNILKKICAQENINIIYEKVMEEIINHSQSDIRRLIYTLQDIKYAYGSALITSDLIDEYCIGSQKKDIDIDLFTATKSLLYNYENMKECLRLYETEKVLLPLMVHQNYIENILLNVSDEDVQFKLVNEITESLAIGDNIENYIYGEQNWAMQEIHGFYTCIVPSYYTNETITRVKFQAKPLFPADLNRTSIKNINKKGIIKTNKCFKDMTIFDYICINKIIRKLISENKTKECVEFLQTYNIKLEHVDSLLKIDKIKNTKTALTPKQKKEFSKYIEK